MSNLGNLISKIASSQAILLASPANITYFTSFNQFLTPGTRESLALISQSQTTVFHPFFTTFEKQPELNYRNSCQISAVCEHIELLKNQYGISELLIEAEHIYLKEYWNLEKIDNLQVTALDQDWIWQQRTIKTAEEIVLMKNAFSITNKAFSKTLKQLHVGISELELLELLIKEFKILGARGEAFPSIVAFGPHTALPHHQPTEKRLENNTPVLIDCGVKYQNYCADMTRTIWFGNKPDPQFSKIEAVVKKAYQTAKIELDKVSAGETITAARLDQAARQVIANAGYGPQFIHTTGHGLGLEIHEPPSLNSHNLATIKPGMTITIEPAIYLENKFGYRFENTLFA